jgi:predicted GNAT superfamily acetyltransferase
MANVFFFGNDKRWGYDTQKDLNADTYYSAYLEAGYTFAVRENNIDVFAGFTPAAGAYGNTMGFVNVGLTGYRKIRITDQFELPVKASLVFNPQSSAVFATFGITL